MEVMREYAKTPSKVISEAEDRENGKDEKKYRVGGHKKKFTLKDAKQKAEEIHKKTGIIVSIEKIDESEDEMDDRESEMVHISKIKPNDVVRHGGKTVTVGQKDIKHGGFMGSSLFGDSYKLGKDKVERVLVNKKKSVKESEDHDEEKETQEDPTREKLETAKDEADEKKGGPAELAADLRVSVRIEKMGIGRYKRMLTKHELSSDDEEWLKKRIGDLEDCVKSMEAKIPELEKEAEAKDIKESMVKGIRQAIFELAKG
jgi:hypothetical protein